MALNERQRAFCEHYVKTMNATQAAKDAGYSEKTAGSQGQRLLKNVEIRKCLGDVLQQASNGRVADAEEVLGYLTNVMRGVETEESYQWIDEESRMELVQNPVKHRERLRAAEMLGKRHVLFTDKVRHEGEIKTTSALDDIAAQLGFEGSDDGGNDPPT